MYTNEDMISNRSIRICYYLFTTYVISSKQLCGGLAQSVECVLCKHEARGSKPRFSTFFVNLFEFIKVTSAKSIE